MVTNLVKNTLEEYRSVWVQADILGRLETRQDKAMPVAIQINEGSGFQLLNSDGIIVC